VLFGFAVLEMLAIPLHAVHAALNLWDYWRGTRKPAEISAGKID
jgi:hypothetical protein